MLGFLIPLALVATALVLLVGIFAMMRGGEFNRKYGNKLMRLRIIVQAVAIALILFAIWLGNQGT